MNNESAIASSAVEPVITYARRLGVWDASMVVVGGVIGSGIFLTPHTIAQQTGSSAEQLLAWLIGGAIALVGALCYAELGARRPTAGGGYVYLRDAFGPLPAFLYGWALLVAIASGATAAVAVTFASYAAPLLGMSDSARIPLAAAVIIILAIVNIVGVEPGTMTQNVFTILKLAAIGALVAGGLGSATLSHAVTAPTSAPARAAPGTLAVALGTALVPVLFAYGGWQQTNFVAGEMIEPRRNLPRALVWGVLVVAAVYLAVNFTYLRTLGVAGLAASSAPAADAMALRFGPVGRTLIAVGIAVSTFGFLDIVILVTPRVYQAMARDGLFFRRLAVLHPRFRTPVAAIALQAAWAIALLLTGTYGELLDYVTFADWIFFGATAATLVVYRRRDRAGGESGFRAPFYPWSVALFVLAAAYVIAGAVVSSPRNALHGVVLLAIGALAYAWWRSRLPLTSTQPAPGQP